MSKEDFDKIIWKLFKLDRSEFNKADRRIEKILRDVYSKGVQQGIKDERKRLKSILS